MPVMRQYGQSCTSLPGSATGRVDSGAQYRDASPRLCSLIIQSPHDGPPDRERGSSVIAPTRRA